MSTNTRPSLLGKPRRQLVDALRSLNISVDARKLPGMVELHRAEIVLWGMLRTNLNLPERWRAVLIAVELNKAGAVQAPNPCRSPVQYLNQAQQYLRSARHALNAGDAVLARGLLLSAEYQQDAYVKASANHPR